MPTAQSGFFEWVLFFVKTYGSLFLQGAGTTLLIALTGTIVGFIIGLGVGYVRAMPCERENGLGRYYLLKVVRTLLGVYIEIFRSTPMIVQAMVIFYGMAAVFHINLPHLLAGFVIVLRERSTTHGDIQNLLESVKLADSKILGFIKVGCTGGKKGYGYRKYGYGKYYYYQYY